MGMDYHIETDIELDDDGDLTGFPGQLSDFFAQIGGYGHCSEVSQLSSILDIDLSLFQNYDFPENPDSETTWQSVESLISKISELELAIETNSDYHKKIKYRLTGSPRGGAETCDEDFMKMIENMKSADINNVADLATLISKSTSEEVREENCPEDHGYISSNQLVRDVKTLRENLEKLGTKGVKKIKLFYS